MNTLAQIMVGFITLFAFLFVCAALLGIGYGIAAKFAYLIIG